MKFLRLLLLFLILASPTYAQTGPGALRPPPTSTLLSAVTTDTNSSPLSVRDFGAVNLDVAISGGTVVVTVKARINTAATFRAIGGYSDADGSTVSTITATGSYTFTTAGKEDIEVFTTSTSGATTTVIARPIPSVGKAVRSGGGSTSLAVGTTAITGGTSGRVLKDNAGTVGEYPVAGSGANVPLIDGTLVVASGKTATVNDNITLASDGTGTRTLNVGAGGTLGSNAFTSTAYVPQTTTVNSKALSGNITLGLASSDFANQGTTTTILHGNAAGNPAFGQVVNADITNGTIDLTTKVTGVLPAANGGTGVNNGSSTITIGGSVVFSGAFAATITSTATTNSTLPAGTDTLMGLAAVQTVTGAKTFNAGKLTPVDVTFSGGSLLDGSTANVLEQRNGTNAQTLFVYGTYTNASNYERLKLQDDPANGVYVIGEQAGTGTARGMIIGTTGAANLNLQTNNSIRWRIDSSGNIVAAADNTLNIGASGATRPAIIYLATGAIIQGTGDASSTTTGALQVAGGAAIRKRVFIDGITASSGLQTAVLCQSSGGEMIADSVACLASSGRFKWDIKPLVVGLDEVMRLRPVSYRYKPEGIFAHNLNFQRERVGFIAEDINQVDSRLVGYEADGKTPRTIGYDQITPILVKSIQELKAEVDALKAEIQSLKQPRHIAFHLPSVIGL